MEKRNQKDLLVLTIASGLALGFLLTDLALPLGAAAGVPYIAVVMVGWWLSKPRYVLAIAVILSVLVVAGYYLSPPGGIHWIVMINRGLALLAIWSMAVLVLIARNAERSLRRAQETLEQRVEERTTKLEREVAERRSAQNALSKSEQRLAVILDIAADGIISMSRSGRIHLFNKGAEAIFGYDAEEVIGRHFEMLMPAQFHDTHHRHLDAFLQSPQESRLMSERNYVTGLRKDGTEFALRAAISKFTMNGETILTVMLHDVTELQRTSDALRESERTLQARVADLENSRERLERQATELVRLAEDIQEARNAADTANHAKSDFLATMSHELRTPLNAIIGFSEVIEGEIFGPVGSPKYLDYIRDVRAAGQHLLDLINDILDLSKVESENDSLNEESINVAEAMQAVLTLVKQRAAKRDVTIKLDIANDLPMLYADPRKLKQILVNLLTNALKFTDVAGKVTVRAWCDGTGGLAIQVADTGIGMAPKDIPMALSRFGQVGHHPTHAQEGTGLGLPLSKALAEQHGGSLNLQSTVGVGTTVDVRFPVERSLRQERA